MIGQCLTPDGMTVKQVYKNGMIQSVMKTLTMYVFEK